MKFSGYIRGVSIVATRHGDAFNKVNFLSRGGYMVTPVVPIACGGYMVTPVVPIAFRYVFAPVQIRGPLGRLTDSTIGEDL